MKRQLVEFVFFFFFLFFGMDLMAKHSLENKLIESKSLEQGVEVCAKKKRHSNEILLANNKMRYHVL